MRTIELFSGASVASLISYFGLAAWAEPGHWGISKSKDSIRPQMVHLESSKGL
jgi:hypothetical protein